MKRVISLLMALCLCVSLCGGALASDKKDGGMPDGGGSGGSAAY